MQQVRLCHLRPWRRRNRSCDAVQGLDRRCPRLTKLAQLAWALCRCSRLVVAESVFRIEELNLVVHAARGAGGAFGARGGPTEECQVTIALPTWQPRDAPQEA